MDFEGTYVGLLLLPLFLVVSVLVVVVVVVVVFTWELLAGESSEGGVGAVEDAGGG